MLARQALTLLSANQRRVLSHPNDVSAREAMLLGATLAGQAFANAPVAAVHALAYPLGGHYHMPHGLSNALMLPAVLRFNQSMAEAEYLELAALLPDAVKPGVEGFVSWFEELIADAALPTTLEKAGVPAQDLPMLAADAMQQQRLLINNPVEVDEAAALSLYSAAWSGAT
jgi:alcohol dehydrogenase